MGHSFGAAVTSRGFHKFHKALDLMRRGRERGHQPHQYAVADGAAARQAYRRPWIEARAFGAQPLAGSLRQRDEYFIGFDRPYRDVAGGRKPGAESIGHGVGVTRKAQPEIVGEIGLDLRSQKAVLGHEMAAALAAFLHAGGTRGIE